MRPPDRNLRGSQSMMAREVQQLRIEAESFDALLLENNLARLALKSLEATLRVHERQAQAETNDGVENDPGKLPE